MELVLISVVALLTSGLTLFSGFGFGLGTVLMPVFVLFLPVPLAIAATAVVYFANNIFKFGLMAKKTDWRTVARFGLPAVFAQLPALASYTLGGRVHEITPVKAAISAPIAAFALLELSPRFASLVLAATFFAFAGAWIGKRLLKKVPCVLSNWPWPR
ncbi:hypothetical protein SCD_n02742 [Sulfuricella denitrificans skB26]|uniref:Membrane transporter protein n=1 Tax=Sulfuricella denitrificans (strain DSM 22764 / NBRC 105220 / skB26) TaxID=1163617 RepID=S6B7Y6_SULDS|nr:TSUP family transporter [Sulfuricella denitrificans]BAN36542.1 hypothetical protein SCD_n02742 [Sulfuricella denitrificans skB26]